MAHAALPLPHYCRTLRPNRSLTPRGAAAALALNLGTASLLGAICLALGAWPVLPFLLVQLAGVGLVAVHAFRHRHDFERIMLDDRDLTVVRRCGNRLVRHRFQRYWARVRLERGRPLRVYVGSHGCHVELGRELEEEQRRALGRELERLLRH